jgi:hypothetical protein
MRNIAKRSVLRMFVWPSIRNCLCNEAHAFRDPEIKRATCRKCCSLLIPGQSSTTRISPAPQRHSVVTCLFCGQARSYLLRSNYQLRTERERVSASQ